MPKMIKTKIANRRNKFILLKADELGKYKTVQSFDTKLEAINFRKELVDDAHKALRSIANITVVDAYAKYTEYKYSLYDKYNQLSESQANTYKRYFNKWINNYFPKDILLRKLLSKDLRNFFLKVREHGCTFKSAVPLVYSFKGMFEWCVDQDLVSENDFNFKFFEVRKYPELIPTDGSDKAKKTVMINRFEVNKLLKSIKPEDINDYDQVVKYVCINFFVYTGARPAEVRAIEWNTVNLDYKRIKIEQQIDEHQNIKKKLKAAGSERILFIPTRLLKILERWKQYQSDRIANPRFVFEHPYNRMPITDKELRNYIYRHYAKIGLAIIEDRGNHIKIISCKFKREPFKTFRHYASTALLDAQAANPQLSDNFIKTQIGHRDIRTTRMIYGDHNDLDYQSNKDQEIDKALDNALKLN